MQKKAGVAVLLFILILDLMGFTLIFPLIPAMLSHYVQGASLHAMDDWVPGLMQWLLRIAPDFQAGTDRGLILFGGLLGAVYALLQFLFSPYWGRLSDRVGRKPVLMLTSLGLAGAYLVWGFSTTFTVFVLSRVLAGIMAGNLGVATAAMADHSDASGRTQSMGLVGAAFGVGFILGPALGGVLSHVQFPFLAGWLHPFSAAALASFALSLLSALLNWFFLRESLPIASRSPSFHLEVESPLHAVGELREPAFRQMLFLNFFFMLLFTSFEFTVTFLYSLDFGLSPPQIGWIFFYLGLLLAFGQGFLVRRLAGHVTERQMILGGFLLIAVSLVPLALSAPVVQYSLLALLPLATGSALLQPAMAGLASRSVPAEQQGLAMGSFRSMGSLARAIGPLFGAWLYGSLGIVRAYSAIAVLLFVGYLFAWTLRMPERTS